MTGIRPAELDERRDDEGVFVLDVRPRERFHEGHVDGSHNGPVYGDLRRGDPEAFERVESAVPDEGATEVAIVCEMGVVARRATEHLRGEGHEARTLAGGMSAWRGACGRHCPSEDSARDHRVTRYRPPGKTYPC